MGGAAGQSGKSPAAGAVRPISAVPSEYSDVSTSSCRSTTSEAEEDEHHHHAQLQPKGGQLLQSSTSVTLVNSGNGGGGKSALCATASNASTVLVSDKDDREAKVGVLGFKALACYYLVGLTVLLVALSALAGEVEIWENWQSSWTT